MSIKDLTTLVIQKVLAAWAYIKATVISLFQKIETVFVNLKTKIVTLFKKSTVSPTIPTEAKQGSVFSVIGDAAGSFFDEAKVWIFVIMLVLILLLSGGFYFYYHYSKNELSAALAGEQTAINSFNTEKSSFETMQEQNKNLLGQLSILQTNQAQVQQSNDELRKQIEQYNYTTSATTNSGKTQKDVNKVYTGILNQLEEDTAIKDPSKSSDEKGK